jgi:hypothetical protein
MTRNDPALSPATEPEDDEELVDFLEPDQLVTDKSRHVPRVRLTTRASFWLWMLRVFVLVVSAMVIYTFFAQLNG